MPSLCRYFKNTMQKYYAKNRDIMEMLCYWHTSAAFHTDGVQATCQSWCHSVQSAEWLICKICWASRWSWETSSTWTWKPSSHNQVASSTSSPRARQVFIIAGLTTSCVKQRWLQPCPKTSSYPYGMFRAVSWQSKLRNRGRKCTYRSCLA